MQSPSFLKLKEAIESGDSGEKVKSSRKTKRLAQLLGKEELSEKLGGFAELVPSAAEVNANGVSFHHIRMIENETRKYSVYSCLARHGYIVFANSGGPTFFAISVESGKVHEFWSGNLAYDNEEKWVYVGLEKLDVTGKNIEKSSKNTWANFEEFACDIVGGNVIDDD